MPAPEKLVLQLDEQVESVPRFGEPVYTVHAVTIKDVQIEVDFQAGLLVVELVG